MSIDTPSRKENLQEQKHAIKNYLTSLFDSNPKPVAKKSESKDVRLPQWAGKNFTALNFRSGGLQLYVPISYVRGIKNVIGGINPIEGAPAWIKGSIATREQDIIIVDTEKMIAVKGKQTIDYQHPDRNAYVILLGDGSIGLSCDTVGQVKQISVDEVHWSPANSKKRWLAGMMKNEVAALIEPRRLALAVSMESALV